MQKIQHSTNNAVLGAPRGWNQGEVPCDALPVTRTERDGLAVVVSYWRPTADELAVLAAGGSVALMVVGTTMPPVALMVACAE